MSRITAKIGTFYHFTSAAHLPRIEACGQIKRTESNVGSPSSGLPPFGTRIGPDVVWLLDTPELDGRPHGLTGSVHDKTAVRMQVRCRATRWLDWPPGMRMHPQWRAAMIRTGGGLAAAKHWWVCTYPIPSSDWKTVELREEDGNWKTLSIWSPLG